MYRFPLLIALISFSLPALARGEVAPPFHFEEAKIPANESRLAALAGVREFRCNYRLPVPVQGTLLLAEFYQDGKCTRRQELAFAKHDPGAESQEGVISIGWREDGETLVSVLDNGQRDSPWTRSARFPGFQPQDAYFFNPSQPELRKAARERGVDFELYPVLGLCGQRSLRLRGQGSWSNAAAYLKACEEAKAKGVIIIYLYVSKMDETPALKFDKP